MNGASRILRRTAVALLLGFAGLMALAGEAAAHRLKLFVTAEAGEIAGYAFFIGGGRPEGVDFAVKVTDGREVHRGRTDAHGAFRWRPETAADYTVVVDAGDGHWTEATITADRLTAAVGPQTPSTSPPTVKAATAAPASETTAAACPEPVDAAALARLVEARVDAAVARQLRPLIEAQVAAEGRVRFNDVMGGVGMIVGLAGAGLWATARRRRSEGEAS